MHASLWLEKKWRTKIPESKSSSSDRLFSDGRIFANRVDKRNRGNCEEASTHSTVESPETIHRKYDPWSMELVVNSQCDGETTAIRLVDGITSLSALDFINQSGWFFSLTKRNRIPSGVDAAGQVQVVLAAMPAGPRGDVVPEGLPSFNALVTDGVRNLSLGLSAGVLRSTGN